MLKSSSHYGFVCCFNCDVYASWPYSDSKLTDCIQKGRIMTNLRNIQKKNICNDENAACFINNAAYIIDGSIKVVSVSVPVQFFLPSGVINTLIGMLYLVAFFPVFDQWSNKYFSNEILCSVTLTKLRSL